MIVSIMQPAYLPWLGYFDRIWRSDLHIVLDSVPLGFQTKTAFTTRNRIRTAAGATWLTVPVQSGQHQTIIHDVVLAATTPWARKHGESLRHAYGRAAHWDAVAPLVPTLYQPEWTTLTSVLDTATAWLCDTLRITTPTVRASSLPVQGSKGDLILALCTAVGASTYLSGPFGRDYLNAQAFSDAGVALTFHDYAHPEYTQGSAPFLPYLSVVDLLAHHGPRSLDILTGQLRDSAHS